MSEGVLYNTSALVPHTNGDGGDPSSISIISASVTRLNGTANDDNASRGAGDEEAEVESVFYKDLLESAQSQLEEAELAVSHYQCKQSGLSYTKCWPGKKHLSPSLSHFPSLCSLEEAWPGFVVQNPKYHLLC